MSTGIKTETSSCSGTPELSRHSYHRIYYRCPSCKATNMDFVDMDSSVTPWAERKAEAMALAVSGFVHNSPGIALADWEKELLEGAD